MAFRDSTANLDLSTDTATAPIDIIGFSKVNFQATWSGVISIDSVFQVECSVDAQKWNQVGGTIGKATLTDPADTQVWEIIDLTARFVRLSYIANTNTAGSAEVLFLGSEK